MGQIRRRDFYFFIFKQQRFWLNSIQKVVDCLKKIKKLEQTQIEIWDNKTQKPLLVQQKTEKNQALTFLNFGLNYGWEIFDMAYKWNKCFSKEKKMEKK